MHKQSKAFQSIIESAFYHNSVERVATVSQAYHLALASSKTIVTDLPVKHCAELGLSDGARVLVDNHGSIVGRTAKARRILGFTEDDVLPVVQEAVYELSKRKTYHASSRVGLDDDYQVRANLLVPEGYENNLYNFMLNFDGLNQEKQATGLYLITDPEWRHPAYPDGLVVLDPLSHCGIVLGLRYFGEIKKGILSLSWNHAKQNGYVPCHGGLKCVNNFSLAVFGLSGSGKSTITLANHDPEDQVRVLHDDAFIVNQQTGKSIALEPSYFDKTADYPMGSEAVQYFITVQNNGVTQDENGKRILLTEDIRNGNGRTIKSHFATANRVNHLDQPLQAICWIMKDETLPPLLRIKDPVLGSAFGACMTTVRSNAENSDEVGKMVVEPYANPFRLYPLREDYQMFKDLFISREVVCYILNTGSFLGKKVSKEVTLDAVRNLIHHELVFKPWIVDSGIEYAEIEGYEPPLASEAYHEKLKQSFKVRSSYLEEADEWNKLPDEALTQMVGILHKIDLMSE